MAQFIGFKCDSCGAVISTDDRNRVTVKFDGPAATGEFTEDRCSDCVVLPEGVELRPLRRRRTREEIEAEEAAAAASCTGGAAEAADESLTL